MIVITGAGGKTGQAIINSLAGKETLLALVRRPAQTAEALAWGATEAKVIEAGDEDVLNAALNGTRAVYHICPNMHPAEVEIARAVIAAAQRNHLERFVYHSVLHPSVEAMPHHWLKMRVEELVFRSGLDFTILQPCAYMQNVIGYWESITREGIFPILYSPEARISIVDLQDVAVAAARVLCEAGHAGAIYELAGPETLSQNEIVQIMSEELGRRVRVKSVDPDGWETRMRGNGMSEYAVQSLLKMFEYYNQNGFTGCPRVLEGLLGRPAVRFSEFIRRFIKGGLLDG